MKTKSIRVVLAGITLLALGFCYPSFVLAQAKDRARPQVETQSQEGKLFTVTLTRQDRVLRVDLAGIPAAKFDFKNKDIEVMLIEGKNRRSLKVMRQDGYFQTEPISQIQNMEIEIKAKHKSESESFQFKIP